MTSVKTKTIVMWLLLSLQVALFTAFLAVGAITTGMDWLLAGGTGALLAVSAAAVTVNREMWPDVLVVAVAYAAAGLLFLSRSLAWDTSRSVVILLGAWVAAMTVPEVPSNSQSDDRPMLYGWAAPLGGAMGALLLAIWRGGSSVVSGILWLTSGIRGGNSNVELLFLVWGVYASAGILTGLAARAIKGGRTAYSHKPDGTLDTAGRPNYHYQSRSFDTETGQMVAGVFVVCLAALLTVVWKGAGGAFASAGIDYRSVPRLLQKTLGAWPLFVLYFTGVVSLPGLRWKLSFGFEENKLMYRVFLWGIYALLLVGAAAVALFALMYARRIGAG